VQSVRLFCPPSDRCTAVSLGYNICQGVIGGLTPLVATWLVERTGDEIAPAFLIMASAAVAAVTLMCFAKPIGRHSLGILLRLPRPTLNVRCRALAASLRINSILSHCFCIVCASAQSARRQSVAHRRYFSGQTPEVCFVSSTQGADCSVASIAFETGFGVRPFSITRSSASTAAGRNSTASTLQNTPMTLVGSTTASAARARGSGDRRRQTCARDRLPRGRLHRSG
jgi:hypothetical protein